jgi:hypothetical protein
LQRKTQNAKALLKSHLLNQTEAFFVLRETSHLAAFDLLFVEVLGRRPCVVLLRPGGIAL